MPRQRRLRKERRCKGSCRGRLANSRFTNKQVRVREALCTDLRSQLVKGLHVPDHAAERIGHGA
jgi:hypothetical protein